MKFLSLHGVRYPALGFGTWRLQDEVCERAVRMALDIGYRHIDTAQIYENEANVGKAIAQSGVPRKELFVTTKLWLTNMGAERVAASTEGSLSRLRMDYVDLLLLHWPNPDVPLEETLEALQDVMKKGKTKLIGVSNYPVAWMREAVERLQAPIACNQMEYHVKLPQQAALEYAKAHGIAITAYCPLARGELTDNAVLAAIGKKYHKNANQIALRWLLEQDIAAIPKSTKMENAKANFDIFDFALDTEDYKNIAALDTHRRLVSPAFAPQWDAN